jgi:hypothetical protein
MWAAAAGVAEYSKHAISQGNRTLTKDSELE